MARFYCSILPNWTLEIIRIMGDMARSVQWEKDKAMKQGHWKSLSVAVAGALF